MPNAIGRRLATLMGLLVLSARAYADQPDPRPSGGLPTPPIPPLVQPAPALSPPTGHSRVTAGVVLGSGVLAIAAGTTIALAATSDWGSPNRLGLGIACAGVPLAMVGTMLWFNVPQSGTQVRVGPSSLIIAGRF